MKKEIKEQPILLSIRCIVFNHEPYLRKCLEGFVMQKTNFRFIAIVHDDASTDNSAAIIREFEEKYPDIIKPIYEEENQWSKHDGSLKRILNEHTVGKYVALCEGDDCWTDSNKLQKQVDFLEAHPDYSLCFHNAVVHWVDGSAPDRLMMDGTYSEREYKAETLYTDWFYATASLVFRRSVYDCKAYKQFQTKNMIIGDVPLMMSATTVGKIYGFTDIMSIYNRHNMGVSSQYEFYLCIFRLEMAVAEIIDGNICKLWRQVKMKYAVRRAFFELYTKRNTSFFVDVVKMACKNYPFAFLYWIATTK